MKATAITNKETRTRTIRMIINITIRTVLANTPTRLTDTTKEAMDTMMNRM